MPHQRRIVVALASIGALAAATMPLLDSVPAHATPFNTSRFAPIQRRLASGALMNVLGTPAAGSTVTPKAVTGPDDSGDGADGAPNPPPAGFTIGGPAGTPVNYYPAGAGSCSTNFGSNIKVNQNCLNVSDPDLQGRGQANNETSIAQDPMRPEHLVASNNDYVRGDGTCGAAYSTTNGVFWNNSTVPNVFTRGIAQPIPPNPPRQYWQAGGDTSVAWDTRGNAYLSCQLFNRGASASPNPDQSSAFVVFRSTGNNGASWNFPGRYVEKFLDSALDGSVLEDKQLITVDNHVGSPFRDRVYVSWTEFAADGSAYIWESYSSNYGESFSPRVLVSANDNALCTNTQNQGTPNGRCNENQFSQPFTGPDGALYVVFSNFNNPVTGSDNRNQVLLSKSTDGGVTFSPPVKVSDYYDLPDCNTYQGPGADSGRSCVPEKGPLNRSVFRAGNYASGAVNPVNNQVVVTFGSYINAVSKETNGCIPAGTNPASGQNMYTGVKAPGACNNKILISTSNNGGATFTGTGTDPRNETMVTQAPGQVGTDQWFQWAAINPSGNLAVSYYDRQYGNDEVTGYSDFSISGSRNMVNFGQSRVTSSSMPPPTEFPNRYGGLFWGDYTGLAYAGPGIAFPLWSDTRPTDVFLCPTSATGPGNPPALCTGTHSNGIVANDQDMYTALVVPPIG